MQAVSCRTEVCYPFAWKHGKPLAVKRREFITLLGDRRRGQVASAQHGGRMRRNGVLVWARFNVPTNQTLWYYRSLADIFCEKLSNQLSNELREIVDVLEAEGLEPIVDRTSRRRTSSG